MGTKVLLFITFLLISYLYIPLNKRVSRYYWKSRHDDHIPLIPIFVLPYIFFFPFIGVTILFLWNSLYIDQLLATLILAKVAAMIFWYFVPNGVSRPVISLATWVYKLLAYIYRHDNDTNAFPSEHVYISAICAYFLSIAYPHFSIWSWGAATIIILSTVFTKQHYVIDVVGGFLVALPILVFTRGSGIY